MTERDDADDLSTPLAKSPADRSVLDRLVEQRYARLKQLASKIRWSDPGASLTATGLLNEAYIKLSGKPGDLGGKQHEEVLAIIAKAMWEIVADQARSRKALKRGQGIRPAPLDERSDAFNDVSSLTPEDVLTLRIARKDLETADPRMAKILDYRFCLGMTADETALALGLSKSMVERDGREAKKFLKSKLNPTSA